MAFHLNTAYVQSHYAVILLNELVDFHHPVAGQVKGLVAAHQAAAGADLKLHQVEVLFLQETLQSLHMVGHKRVNGAGGAEPVGILLQNLLVVAVLETVHAALHQDGPLHVVAVHDLQRLLSGEIIVAVVAVGGQQLEFLAVAPGGLASADAAQLTATAVAGQYLCQVQMCINFLH